MFRRVIIVLAVVLVLFAAVGLILPRNFHLTRSVSIQAHPMRVINCLVTLDRWEAWWPWDRLNAGNRLEVNQLEAGGERAPTGAAISWSGRPAPGSLVLTQTSLAGIEYDLYFNANTRPDKGAFDIRASDRGTELTWRVDGHFETPVVGGYFALLADAMHGGAVAWGLRNIKDLAESDDSELILYYQDEQGKEVTGKIE